jgi:hypothetical protein
VLRLSFGRSIGTGIAALALFGVELPAAALSPSCEAAQRFILKNGIEVVPRRSAGSRMPSLRSRSPVLPGKLVRGLNLSAHARVMRWTYELQEQRKL